jgi:CRISPR system Cascade subunit CasA
MPLLWRKPWDGTEALPITKLDELCVEVCRRIRLRRTPNGLEGLRAGSECMRVAAEFLGGNVQDPWIPLIVDEKKSRPTYGKHVAFTPSGTGFGYRQMSRLLDKSKVTLPLLAKLSDEDEPDSLLILAAALARGQGGTKGLRRRTVRTYRMKELYDFGPGVALDRVGEVARTRSDEAVQASKRLRRALIMLMSGGKDREDLVGARDGNAESWTTALRRYDQLVDQDFFGESFWVEAVTGLLPEHRRPWRQKLRTICEAVLAEASLSAPRTETRRFEALARAENKLKGLLDAWLKEVADVD